MYRDLCRTIDRFFAGYWFWRIRLWRAEQQLGDVLARYGDLSIQARKATERWARLFFAVEFGRMAPSWERVAVRQALRAGFQREDIRLVVLNREFLQSSGKISVRRSWLVAAWAWTVIAIPFIQWALLCALAVAGPGEAWRKIIFVVGITMGYWILARGLSLYTTRPVAAGARVATKLKAVPLETDTAMVMMLEPRDATETNPQKIL